MELCPPVFAYAVFMVALGLYDIYMQSFPNLATTLFYLLFGGILLWILCAAGMGFVAWGLLSVPVIFYIFVFALVIFQKGFDIQSEESKLCPKPPTPCIEQEPTCETEECEPVCESEDEEECSN